MVTPVTELQEINPLILNFFFQIATSSGLVLTEAGTTYTTPGGHTMQVLGLAELGPPCRVNGIPVCDACYTEDLDNQIDICLSGDREAVETITHVYTPSGGDYLPFYNPGGPGFDPDPNTTYTAPSSFIITEVMNALDDPMTVSYCAAQNEPAGMCCSAEGKYLCCPPLVCHSTEQACVLEGNEDLPIPTSSPTSTPVLDCSSYNVAACKQEEECKFDFYTKTCLGKDELPPCSNVDTARKCRSKNYRDHCKWKGWKSECVPV